MAAIFAVDFPAVHSNRKRLAAGSSGGSAPRVEPGVAHLAHESAAGYFHGSPILC